MSPRSRPRGAWANSGQVVWDVDVDDDNASARPFHWGEVAFEGVPLGAGDSANINVHTGVDERGQLVILGLHLNKPVNARRLKGIPLEAIRRECARLVREADAQMAFPLAKKEEPSSAAALAEIAVNDRQSDEFLALLAQTVREARERGDGGWQTVAQALPNPAGAPMSRAMAQRYMRRAREAGHDLGELSRTTDKAQVVNRHHAEANDKREGNQHGK